ncbi:MAG: hypothetical protein HYZ36_07165 [Pedosphaera parvula]|nr:hypothetical protein [Pedosphaera parvula]
MGLFDKWQKAGFDAKSQITDPQFIDPAKENYGLKPSSPALQLGFQPIPFEKIGLEGYPRAWKK